MVIKKKARFVFVLALAAGALSGLLLSPVRNARADSYIIGPYTEILLPLEDLPALNENLAYHPVIDQYESGATLQIMYVLEDPRDVPLARYAYYNEDLGVIAPNDLPVSYVDIPEYKERMEEIVSSNPKTINVYIRVKAPANQSVPDPLFEDLKQRVNEDGGYGIPYDPNRPAILVYFPGPIGTPLTCAVPEYISVPEPYPLPADLDGGEAVGPDGLYDPAAYAPPRPWYDNQNPMLDPGEIREGWISCLAPDMPTENILIRAIYSYSPEPQSTPTPGPSPTPYDDSACVIVGSFDDPVCGTGVCCKLSANATLDAMILEESDQDFAEEYDLGVDSELVPAWSYSRTASFPEDGIRLEDTSIVFINDEGEQKTANGTVIIESANVVQAEWYEFNNFLFVARVSIESVGLSEDDLKGYSLYRVDANVEIYDQVNALNRILLIEGIRNNETSTYERFMRANFYYPTLGGAIQIAEGKQSFDNMFRHEPVSPFEGYLFTDLVPDRGSPLSHYDRERDGPIPTTLWFSIDTSDPALSEIGDSRIEDRTRYAAKGVNIYNTSLVASTTMCDVVECLDVQDPENDDHEVRTVPLVCPGEWSNDFMIDGLSIEDIDYIGEPAGLISNEAPSLFKYTRFANVQPRAWIYSGRIMGGLSSWWSTKEHYNSAKIVDIITGFYVTGKVYDATTGILPYYFRDSSSYYLSVGDYYHKAGWVSGIATKKLLLFGIIDNERYKKEEAAFLFLEEGPIWKTSCSRSVLPSMSSSEAYAPTLDGSSFDIYERYHQMKFILPGMEFPVSEPSFTGELISLGDESASINEQILKPVDVIIVPGKANEPIYYVQSEDAFYPARKNESDNNLIYLRNAGAELIPPDSSLVLVKLEKVFPAGQLDCRTSPDKIQISYPGYYPITTSPEKLLDFNLGFVTWVCSEDAFSSKWLVFRFPSLDIDQSQLVLSIQGEDNWSLWNLAETP